MRIAPKQPLNIDKKERWGIASELFSPANTPSSPITPKGRGTQMPSTSEIGYDIIHLTLRKCQKRAFMKSIFYSGVFMHASILILVFVEFFATRSLAKKSLQKRPFYA
jgi:hypothetical protein